jgi:hypothetical protein
MIWYEVIIQYVFVITQDLLVFASAGVIAAVCLTLSRKLMLGVSIAVYGILWIWYSIDSVVMMMTASRVTFYEAITFVDFLPRKAMIS